MLEKITLHFTKKIAMSTTDSPKHRKGTKYIFQKYDGILQICPH